MMQDTSFVIDLLRGDEDARAFLDIVEAEARPQKVSAITVLELYEGLARAETPDRKRDEILDVLESKRVVAADNEVMRKTGRLSG